MKPFLSFLLSMLVFFVRVVKTLDRALIIISSNPGGVDIKLMSYIVRYFVWAEQTARKNSEEF